MEKLKVFQSINLIQGELSCSGISKERRNIQQGYAFRGIDDVYNALAPLLSKHKLCILPKVCNRDVTERATAKGGVLFYVMVQMDFTFVSSEDGSSVVITTFGEAMDSGDKATNKAMSAAYKYACIQAFCIPTEGDSDADSQTPEAVLPKKSAIEFPLDATYIGGIDSCRTKEELISYCAGFKKELGEDYAKYQKSVVSNYNRRLAEIG